MDDLPPIVPKPAAGGGWDIVRQGLLQLTIEIEVRATRDPVDSILLEDSRRIGGESHSNGAIFGVGVGFLIGVMHALPFIACDNLDVHFVIVVFEEKGAVTSAGDRASFQGSADAGVENVIVLS